VQYETATISFNLDAVSVSMESVKTFKLAVHKIFFRYQNCRGSFWKIGVATAVAHAVLFWLSYPLVNCQMRTVVFRYRLLVSGNYSVTRTAVTTALVSNAVITQK
jgi:hypothetical protein